MPDIVTMGKPIGNGHPIGAVATTRAIAESFANGMEWFNTFGGNPVSAAAGMAVLDVLEDEELQPHADRVGARLIGALSDLASRHAAIGDVRGHGLFLGVDLVIDRDTKEPDPSLASHVLEQAVARGVLLSSDGPGRNVLKIKPPLPFADVDADRLVEVLDGALQSRSA